MEIYYYMIQFNIVYCNILSCINIVVQIKSSYIFLSYCILYDMFYTFILDKSVLVLYSDINVNITYKKMLMYSKTENQ